MNAAETTVTVLAPCVGVHAEITKQFLAKKTSNASDRLQVAPLLHVLKKSNAKIKAYSLNKNYDITELDQIPNAQLCIITKMRSHPTENDQNQFSQFHFYAAMRQKRMGAKLITFYADNITAYESYDCDLYKNLLYFSDIIITPTLKISEYTKPWAGPKTTIACIPDPGVLKRQAFRPLKSQEQCNLIWFGHNKNFEYLAQILPNLIAHSPSGINFELTLLTTEDSLNIAKSKLLKSLPRSNNWKLRLTPWQGNHQPEQLEEELGRAHISLLPSDPNDPLKNGASHNRLIDSIQSGCITIASPLPAYLELSEACLIGNDFPKLLRRALTQNTLLCQIFEQKRIELLERFSPENNLKQWEALVQSILNH